MTERAAFQYGAASYPLAHTANSSLRDADPALYWAIDFFASVLTTHMQDRLVTEASGLTGPNAITKAVNYVLPYDPLVVLQEQQLGKFPLLAVYRVSSKWRWRTVCRMDRVSSWKVAYVLPSLTGGQRERLQAFIGSAVSAILLDRIENMGDPSWNNGDDPWGPSYANLEEINLVSDVTGSYQIPGAQQGGVILPAWIGDLEVVERQEAVPLSALAGPLSGIDLTLNLVPGDGSAPVTDFVDAQINCAVPTGQLGTVNSRPAWLQPGVA